MSHILDVLNDEQRKIASTLDRPVFVAAGAGSGKTFTLTRRIVWALQPGSGEDGEPFLESLDQALIITFTEKAASEIRERIRGALHEVGMHEAALTADSAWISTIHGMCSRILHSEALELGLNPKFEMVMDHEAEELRQLAVNEVFAEIRANNEFPEIMEAYPATSRGVKGREQSTSILGMATDLAQKASNRVNGFEGVVFPHTQESAYEVAQRLLMAYEELVAIPTKTDAQRVEMDLCVEGRDRLEDFLNQPPDQVTFPALCAILPEVHKPNGNKLKYNEVKEARLNASNLWMETTNLAACEATLPFESQLVAIARRIDERYAGYKRERGVLDNDDLLTYTYRAFKDNPDIAERYRGRFKLVMIDEFQDTNDQQVEMIRLIAGDAPICTVGDAQQSIYRFRGADVEVFNRTQVSVGDGGELVKMDQNFRSSDEILRLVAKVCDDPEGMGECFVPDFMDLEAKTKKVSRYPDKQPRIFYELAYLPKDGAAKSKLSVELQARLLAMRFRKLREAGVRPGDMAILLKRMTNANAFQQALREEGLESIVAGGSTYSDASEVSVVAALLNVLANPRDTRNGLYPALASELFRLDGDDFLALSSRMQETFDAPTKRRIDLGFIGGELIEGLEPSKRLERARRIMERAWREMRRSDIADVVLDVCRDSGWLDRLQQRGIEGRAQAANVLRAIEHVRELAKDNDRGPRRIAADFEAWLDASKTGPATLITEDANAVKIMTVHASKGLEFPVVGVAETFLKPHEVARNGLVFKDDGEHLFVTMRPPADSDYSSKNKVGEPPCLEDCENAYEWRLALEQEEGHAEDRELGRLIYVALTRAVDALVVVSSVESGKDRVAPPSAELLNRRLGDSVETGVRPFDYGGSMQGLKETVSIRPKEGVDDALERALAECPEHAFPEAPAPANPATAAPFELYELEEASHAQVPWPRRVDTFSYSSAHKEEPLVTFERGEEEARDTEFDPDRATALGSAFHVLAQYLAETGAFPEDARIANVSREYGVQPRDKKRLVTALHRWYASDIRRDTLLAHKVLAELPFFVEVESRHGKWLEGAIDLLCDMGGGVCHVIDYKTGDMGLTEDQARQRHAMQARYYAHVLLKQGMRHVTCTFVLVERDVDGQPMTVAYEFDASDVPSLDHA